MLSKKRSFKVIKKNVYELGFIHYNIIYLTLYLQLSTNRPNPQKTSSLQDSVSRKKVQSAIVTIEKKTFIYE